MNDKNQRRQNSLELSQIAKSLAKELDFDLVGIAPVTPGLGMDRYDEWLKAGKQGEMEYMATRRDARFDPNSILNGAKSVVVVAKRYRAKHPSEAGDAEAKISTYAWGNDYHDNLFDRLKVLGAKLAEQTPGLQYRPTVDSAPLMERDYARLAGLGWIAKNTLLINPRIGSFFFLGALLVDQELAYDLPFATDHCGSCSACLVACPTQAFEGSYQLDPRKCISYLTIEHKSAIPDTLKEKLDPWLFGCDVCQDVCPWNQKPGFIDSQRDSYETFTPKPGRDPVSLPAVLQLDEPGFRRWSRGTPMFRSKWNRVIRNAVILVGARRIMSQMKLVEQLKNHVDRGIADAVRWTLDRLSFGGEPK